MKSTVEHLNPTRVKLTVEVPFDELKPHFDKAYGALAGQVRIPGFRPGKVPARILDARLGRGTILSEVVNEAVPAKYGEAITQENIRVLGQPDIEVTRIDDGDALEFTAEVDVRPDIELPDPPSIAVTVPDVEVDRGRHRRARCRRCATGSPSTVAVERACRRGRSRHHRPVRTGRTASPSTDADHRGSVVRRRRRRPGRRPRRGGDRPVGRRVRDVHHPPGRG